MGSELVVVRHPSICSLLSLRDGIEQVGIQHLIPKASVEPLHKRILVGLARLDIQQRNPLGLSPFYKGLGGEFGAVVPTLGYFALPRHGCLGRHKYPAFLVAERKVIH